MMGRGGDDTGGRPANGVRSLLGTLLLLLYWESWVRVDTADMIVPAYMIYVSIGPCSPDGVRSGILSPLGVVHGGCYSIQNI